MSNTVSHGKYVYTASSVKRALENMGSNIGFYVKQSELDKLKCPITGEYPYKSQNKCLGNHIGCINRKYRRCQRRVRVFINDNSGFSYDLCFHFRVSDDNGDGFIDEKDSTMRWLLEDKKVMDKNNLDRIQIQW